MIIGNIDILQFITFQSLNYNIEYNFFVCTILEVLKTFANLEKRNHESENFLVEELKIQFVLVQFICACLFVFFLILEVSVFRLIS